MSRSSELEIESLADVQRMLLPDNPQIRGLRHAVHYQPARVAAGDYYDLMPLSRFMPDDWADRHARDAFGVMIADVSGHGPAAAMEAVQFDAILRTYRADEPPFGPAGALTYANRHFFSRRPRRHYMTVFGALYRPDLGTLSWCSAGHHPALLRRGNDVRLIGEDGDIPLGIDRDTRFSNHESAFEPGDLLLLCTDGVLEATDADGVAFGMQRLAALFRQSPEDANAILDAVVAALQAHQGGALGSDDQTLIVLHCLPT